MKTKILFGFLLVVWSASLAYSSPADYPVKVHVAASELTHACMDDPKGSDCGFHQLLTVTIDGKKYKLESSAWETELLPTGDYQARITKDAKANSGAYNRVYELLFSDGKTAKYQVVGEFE